MARIYSINMILDAEYSQTNIATILQRASNLGCLYFQFLAESLFEGKRALDAQEVALRIYKAYQIRESQYVNIKIQDAYATIAFYKTETGYLHFYFEEDAVRWVKKFIGVADEYSFDYVRYLRLLLKMIEDFALIELRTNDEWE